MFSANHVQQIRKTLRRWLRLGCSSSTVSAVLGPWLPKINAWSIPVHISWQLERFQKEYWPIVMERYTGSRHTINWFGIPIPNRLWAHTELKSVSDFNNPSH